MNRADIRRLCEERLALAEKATPGPWGANGIQVFPAMEDSSFDPPSFSRYEDAQLSAHAGTHDLALMRAVLELLNEKEASDADAG